MDALSYILGGEGIATLQGKEHRYTYKFRQPQGASNSVIFVYVLTGPDNNRDYQYLGFIRPWAPEDLHRSSGGAAREGDKPALSKDSPSFKALDWFLKHLNHPQAKFYHEGVCGACGRKLTTPESIESGFGPVCAKRILT